MRGSSADTFRFAHFCHPSFCGVRTFWITYGRITIWATCIGISNLMSVRWNFTFCQGMSCLAAS